MSERATLLGGVRLVPRSALGVRVVPRGVLITWQASWGVAGWPS